MITLEEYNKASNLIDDFVLNTELIYDNNKHFYIKRESLQKSGSFKWRGVLHSVLNAFNYYIENYNKYKNKPYFMVTQSTGNHGIAVILSVYYLKKHFL